MSPNCTNSDIFFGYKIRILPSPPPPLPWLHYLMMTLYLNLTPLYLPVATIGNALSIAVFRRPAMSSISNGFILIALTDVLVLYICMLELFFHLKGYMNHCKLLFIFMNIWIRKSFLMFDHWLLVLVSIEQTIAVFRPKKERSKLKISGGKICCLYMSLLIFTFFINLPYFFMILLYDPILIKFYNFMNNFDKILTGPVPLMIMFLLDIVIQVKICLKKRRKVRMRKRREGFNQKLGIGLPVSDSETRKENREIEKSETIKREDAVYDHESVNHFRVFEGTILILALNIAAILFDTPYSVATFLKTSNSDIVNATILLIFTRHVLNFSFYFFCFRFRQEFSRLLCCCRQHPSAIALPLKTTPLQTVTGRLGI